jgi:hypothetical protein
VPPEDAAPGIPPGAVGVVLRYSSADSASTSPSSVHWLYQDIMYSSVRIAFDGFDPVP